MRDFRQGGRHMTILFGHPSGNPNSHHAALAHLEAGWLEAFCVPWMPSAATIANLKRVPRLRALADRLSRRRFAPLSQAPTVQGRAGEWRRLVIRALGRGNEGLSYEANDWLMETMRRECSRPNVRALHAYEDCALLQFREARTRGQACLYDMPIGYYPAWVEREKDLMKRFADWLPSGDATARRFVRPAQKDEELELANLVLAPSEFVAETIRRFYPQKTIRIARYGVAAELWTPPRLRNNDGPLRFLFVGQCSLRKGVPLLLEAWRAAGLRDARLDLVGGWRLADGRRKLPDGVAWTGPVDRDALADLYRQADVFVFPSYFEGRALVVGEAMASGLPVITTRESGAEDLVGAATGILLDGHEREELIGALKWFAENRDQIPQLSAAARTAAEASSWSAYRASVKSAVLGYA
jgi:alpha-maltose-1-phosphate synthase